MAQISEFSIILLQMGVSAGHIPAYWLAYHGGTDHDYRIVVFYDLQSDALSDHCSALVSRGGREGRRF